MKTPTIEDLLVRPQPVDLPNKVRVWIRQLSQIERDLCQGAARRSSRDLRKLLEDPKTEEHQLLIVDELEEYNIDQLRDLWVSNRLVAKALEIQRQSLENRDDTFVPEPEGDGITAEQMDRYEDEVDEIEDQREEGVQSAVKAARAALYEEVKALSDKDIRAQAQPALVEHQLSEMWTREFAAQMICRATFNDQKATKPTFKTSRDVFLLKAEVLRTLTESHYGLMIEPEAIKNLDGDQA